MGSIGFTGFGGVRLAAEESGDASDPAVLLVPGEGESRAAWASAAEALADAGRRVISLDRRGRGASDRPADGRDDFEAHVADLRAVLAQLNTRPVIVGAGVVGWTCVAALARDAATLAAGLVLIDLPSPAAVEGPPDGGASLVEAAAAIHLPVLVAASGQEGGAAIAELFPDGEHACPEEADRAAAAGRVEALNALLIGFLERRVPRVIPDYRSGSDARTLRDALGCFATGVTVVTALDPDGAPIGLTANSFTSVSLDPPLLLVCIANGASSAPALRAARHFTVNVLQIGQQPVSTRFAQKGEDRFAGTEWTPGETGAPVLANSLSAFECERRAIHEGGDHFILVGHVLRATFEPRRDPLLYFRGKYRRLHFA